MSASLPTTRLSALGSRWSVAPSQEAAESHLMSELGIPRVVARILTRRGITDPDEAEFFLNPDIEQLHDPKLLPDYAIARDEILGARERGELIFVHGDYDVDGVTSTAIFSRFLKKIGANVDQHVPHRLKEGYGISRYAVEKAHAAGAKLFLTCDCGISAHDSVAYAQELGMRVVITDHHHVPEVMPSALAVVNPHRTDSEYPFADLCGAGIALKLCAGLAADAGFRNDQYYRAFLDLAAIGTVTDVMPLVGENRTIVALGLKTLSTTTKPGIRALIENALGTKASGGVTSRHIGFQLGPRLNAVGRIDDCAIALSLLLETDYPKAKEIADNLEIFNQDRRDEQTRMTEAAIEMVLHDNLQDQPAIVIGSEDWHSGIIGIVAGKVVDRFYRPTFVCSLSGDSGKASGRSISGYNMAHALTRLTNHFTNHGGHELAAGFGFKSENFDQIRKAITEDAGRTLSEEQLVRTRHADAEIDLEDLTLESVRYLDRLAPFGQANGEPVFTSYGVKLVSINPMRDPVNRKLLFKTSSGKVVTGNAFNLGDHMNDLRAGDVLDIQFSTEINTYREPCVALTIKDFARSNAE